MKLLILQSPVTACHVGTNIFLITLFLNTFSLCFSRNMRETKFNTHVQQRDAIWNVYRCVRCMSCALDGVYVFRLLILNAQGLMQSYLVRQEIGLELCGN